MNWKFILSWAVKFFLCTVVYSVAARWTGGPWLAFLMAIGFLIFIAIGESYVKDWIQNRRERKEKKG